jgi:hypothetical protein
MKLEVKRHGLQIVPESEQDEAYIETVLGLKEKDDSIPLRRIAAMGLDGVIAFLETDECT